MSAKRPTRLPLYLKHRDRAILEPAARLSGETLSAFIRRSALEAAPGRKSLEARLTLLVARMEALLPNE